MSENQDQDAALMIKAERTKQLEFAMATILVVSSIPPHKKEDAQFLRGALACIKAEATALIEGRKPSFYDTGD